MQVFNRYLGYVQSIITHYNSKTGRKYADEPAILAWELANEPHTSDLYETK